MNNESWYAMADAVNYIIKSKMLLFMRELKIEKTYSFDILKIFYYNCIVYMFVILVLKLFFKKKIKSKETNFFIKVG